MYSIGMRLKPPLRTEELRALTQSNPTRDLRRLLWEIHRLRALVLHADQVQAMIGNNAVHMGGVSFQAVLDDFRARLDAEPAVQENRKLAREVLNPDYLRSRSQKRDDRER